MQTNICIIPPPGYNKRVKSTRQKIIEYLQDKPISSARQLSRALQVTPANIRHHLSVLKKEGVVEEAGSRPASGRGRPTRLFTLTQVSQQHNLALLAAALLDELLDGSQPEERAAAMQRLAQRLQPSSTGAGSLPQRLYAAVRSLDGMHYRARWEAHAHSPRLILGHCPYLSIVADHPELCSLDASLLGALLGVPVVQLEKLARDDRGAVHCIFALKQNEIE